ncbi:MAG: AIM24 family protein [Cyanobacteriota bacterium]|nr:AIM24 family protein [Cyanobacteriota bacterium]
MESNKIEHFLQATDQDDEQRERFSLANPHVLAINLDGRVWAKAGSMIAHHGEVRFRREGLLEHGLGRLMKRLISGEGTALMQAEGRGRVYLADRGKKVCILRLENEIITVNGNDLLALDDRLQWDIKMMRRLSGLLAGGLFNVRLSGRGLVAITTHFEPLTLRVRPGQPVFTDPRATVAWSGGLAPEVVARLDLRTFVGRGSGEEVLLRFQGTGWVVLQPMEEAWLRGGRR